MCSVQYHHCTVKLSQFEQCLGKTQPYMIIMLCACVCAHVCACMRVCMCVCVRACVRVSPCVHAHEFERGKGNNHGNYSITAYIQNSVQELYHASLF